MLRAHLRVAWRQLVKAPGASLLNVGGLALGVAAAFVLALHVRQELTYDRHFDGADRIYRVATDFFDMGGFAKSQQQLADVLPQEAPAVELVTRFDRGFDPTPVVVGERTFEEPHYVTVDEAFFELFSYRFVEGGRAALQPGEAVLSARRARAYFGDAPAVGRTILVGKERAPHRVVGVVAEPPGRTHLVADLWLPLPPPAEPDAHWTNVTYYTYARLREGASQADLERGLDGILRRHAYPASGFEGSFEAWRAAPMGVELRAQPLTDIYLHSDYTFEIAPGGNPTTVYVLGLVGVFILLIAGVNYVNLTTARASVRAKEVGVKKTLGARKGELVRQFLTETVVLSAGATGLAAAFAEGMLRAFAFVTGAPLVEGVFAEAWHLPALLGLALGVGLVAGVYPAFYLTAFRPAQTLRGAWTPAGNARLRGALVVVQFAVAIALVASSLVVYRQLAFLQDADKGFGPEGVVVVENVGVLGPQAEAFRQRLESLPQVERTSFAGRIPTGRGVWMYTYRTPAMAEALTLQTFPGDADYVATLGLRLVAGRPFSAELASDTAAVLLNEAAVAALGLTGDPLGQEVNEGQRVIGVVRDFHFASLRERIEPVVLTYAPDGDELAVRLRAGAVAGFTDRLETLWRQFGADEPVRTAFLDDNFAALAAQERVLGRAVAFFTALALVIAALGLLGLTAFAVERRTKEIGIRKVVGASAAQLVALLSRDFLLLVGVGFGVAAPAAYLAMSRWLEGFAYRVDLGPGVFLLAGALALLIALLTVGAQALRAATADPVKALRYE